MSDPVETPNERAEAAATRRRWITLAELVGVAGVLIGAISLWMNWNDKQQDKAEKSAEKAVAARVQTNVRLRGAVASGGDSLTLSDDNQKIETVDLSFPPALGIEARPGVVPPRIELDWFAKRLLKATDGGADEQEGRLPVRIVSYWAEPGDIDTPRQSVAIYDIAWKTEGRVLQGRKLEITGIVRREAGGTPARLDALWKRPR